MFEWHGVAYASDLETFFDEDVYLTHQFAGATWYRYFGRRGSSLFGGLGFGRAGFGDSDNLGTLAGWDYLMAAGYEFSKQVQVGAYWLGARLSPCDDDDPDIAVGTVHFGLMLTVVAY